MVTFRAAVSAFVFVTLTQTLFKKLARLIAR